MFLSRGILLIISIFCFTALFAQEKEDQYYDIRVKKQFDSLDINYSITKNNNFKVELITEGEPQKRTQAVYVVSKVSEYNKYEIREIVSQSFKIPKTESKSHIFLELLKENADLKIGTWSIFEYDSSPDFYSATFAVKISTNISANHIYDLIYFVAIEADRLEKKYAKGVDLF